MAENLNFSQRNYFRWFEIDMFSGQYLLRAGQMCFVAHIEDKILAKN